MAKPSAAEIKTPDKPLNVSVIVPVGINVDVTTTYNSAVQVVVDGQPWGPLPDAIEREKKGARHG